MLKVRTYLFNNTNFSYYYQPRYVQICVVCWGKLPSTSDMAAHRASCKIQTNGQTSNNSLRKPDSEKEDNHQSGSSGGPHPHTNVVGNDHHHHHQEVSKLTSIRPEQLVTTPDIQCYEDIEGPDTSSATSKTSSPPPPAPPNLHHTTVSHIIVYTKTRIQISYGKFFKLIFQFFRPP